MSGAPVVLTSEELATREARTVVMVSSEEILPRRIEAYSKNKSEISWMWRQPSASAIMINKPYIELEVQFTVKGAEDTHVTPANLLLSTATIQANAIFGRAQEGLPFLSKCVRTSVISINGATQTYRNSEFLTPYLRTQVSREAMKKINVGWNDFKSMPVGGATGYTSRKTVYQALSETTSEQAQQFEYNSTLDNTLAGATPFLAVAGDAKKKQTQRMTFREPLVMGIFNGLQGNDAFPLWSCEQNKSPSILHAQQVTINLNLLDNWAQNLYGLYQKMGAVPINITDVDIVSATMCCTYVQPPPKFIASALSSNVTYASYKMLRFEVPAANNLQKVAPLGANGAPFTFQLNTVSFPYMPSAFMIEIQPDYNTKSKLVAPGNSAGGYRYVRNSKDDRRMGIVQLDLIINTSPDVVPSSGTNTYAAENVHNIRYNTRRLYELYLKNCSSLERAPYTFMQWFKAGCTVLLTPADFNGILTPAHCRGNISVSGTIYAVNTLGYSAYVGSGAPPDADGDAWVNGNKLEKFKAAIIAIYSNQYLALDAKSGLVGANVMSEQFAAGLRLSNL